MWFENFELRTPSRPHGGDAGLKATDADMYPYECRLRSLTYASPLYATICRKIDDEPEEKINICIGDIPIMVRS